MNKYIAVIGGIFMLWFFLRECAEALYNAGYKDGKEGRPSDIGRDRANDEGYL